MNHGYYEAQYNPRHSRAYYPPHQEYIQDDYPPIMTQSSSAGTSQYYHQQQEYYDYVPRKRRNKIDRTVNLHLDGEPMNDLEVIAAKNAAKNERKSKIVYPDELSFQENHDSVSPLNTMMESLSVSSLASTLVEDAESSTLSNFKDEDQLQQQDQGVTKKKAWPFVSLFKKKPALATPAAAVAALTTTTSITSPPTPVLSPDCNSTTSQASSLSSIFEELDGTWVFTYPTVIPMTPIVWVRFDNENQKRISDHVRSSLPVVQFFDSHIGAFRVLVTVIPAQRACYIPIANQLSRLNLNYIPSHLAHQ